MIEQGLMRIHQWERRWRRRLTVLSLLGTLLGVVLGQGVGAWVVDPLLARRAHAAAQEVDHHALTRQQLQATQALVEEVRRLREVLMHHEEVH